MSENIVVVLPRTRKAERWLSANVQPFREAFYRIHKDEGGTEPAGTHPHGFFLETDGKRVDPDWLDLFVVVQNHSRTNAHGALTGRDLEKALRACGANLKEFLIDAPEE